MREGSPTLVRREDYTAPAYWVRTVDLTFDLDPAKTIVASKLAIERNPERAPEPLRLGGALGVPLDRELARHDGLGGIEVEREVDSTHPVGRRRVVFTTNQGRGAFTHMQSL